MPFAGFWQAYQHYCEAGSKERQGIDDGGARFEIYISMGTPRARFQAPAAIDVAGSGPALERLAAQHRLNLDFRDDSYVVMDHEGGYMGRVRAAELLFTPDRFVDRTAVLEDLVALY